MKFSPGQIVFTPGALSAFEKNPQPTWFGFLARHTHGDWGDLCDEDRALNDEAVYGETRILSAYHLSDKTKIWVITEWDRSVTTFLLPSEY
jgi:hypothetical protein